MTRLRNLKAAPLQVHKQPRADLNPEGKAAKRRRKQMARKNPAPPASDAADSSDPPRAETRNLALSPYAVIDEVTHKLPPEVWDERSKP